jgi:hypothetical protein
MDTQSELEKFIKCLEDERKALYRTTVVLGRKRDNISKYIELLEMEPTHNNAPKRRAQIMLGPIREHSEDLFILCALATNQRMIGTVKWDRFKIDTVIQWWDRADKPLTALQHVQRTREGIRVYCLH